jgi:hypothetical protein
LNSTHDFILLDGRMARFSSTAGIAGHFAKQAIGVAPLDNAHEDGDRHELPE